MRVPRRRLALLSSPLLVVLPWLNVPAAAQGPSLPVETAPGVYSISTTSALLYMDAHPSAYAVTGVTLNLTANLTLPAGTDWVPFGTIANGFQGIFNGQGHAISDLVVSASSSSAVGLFNDIGGTVDNLEVSGTVSGFGDLGAGIVAGILGTGGTLFNVSASGTVSIIGGENVGGVVGWTDAHVAEFSHIASYVTVDATRSEDAGDVAGVSYSPITDALARGSVTATQVYGVGGLVGATIGSIGSSYAAASLVIGTAVQYAGLFVGEVGNVSDVVFQGDYASSSGTLSGIGPGPFPYAGTVDVLAAPALTVGPTATAYVGWDFAGPAPVWGYAAGYNGGYPYFVGLNPPVAPPASAPFVVRYEIPWDGQTRWVSAGSGFNTLGALTESPAAGFAIERAALDAGASLSGSDWQNSFLVSVLSGVAAPPGPGVSAAETGMAAALFERLGVLPTWDNPTAPSLALGLQSLLKAKAPPWALETYLVELGGFSWAAAQSEAAAGFPAAQTP